MMAISKVPAVAFAAALTAAALAAQPAEGPPVAPPRPVTDTYFGTPVVDAYRYLENLQDPAVAAWMKAQAAYTRQVLDRIPGRAALAARIESLTGADLRRRGFVRRGRRLFYEVQVPGAQLAKLAYRDGVAGAEHVLFDPDERSTGRAHHVALDWYEPSWDGRYVAYGVSEGGSERSVLHVLDVDSRQDQPEAIDRTSSCVVSWRADNRSFYYLRYPAPGPDTPPSQTEYNAITYEHVLGRHPRGDGDEAVFGRGVSAAVDVPEGQGTYVLLAPDSPYAIAVADHNMDFNPKTYYVAPVDRLRGRDTPWRKIADPAQGITEIRLRGDRMYFLSSKGAPKFRLSSLRLAEPDVDRAELVVPEGPGVVADFAAASDALYVVMREGARFTLQRVSFDGAERRGVALPSEGTVAGPVADAQVPGVMFNLQGWVRSPREYDYDPQRDVVTDTGLIPPSAVERRDVEAFEEMATSYDGTRIPVSIIAKRGLVRNDSHPALLLGYGSYGMAMDPYFAPSWLAWIEQGGIVAMAHVRGGGEYGDLWHRDGQGRRKINTILDFNAVGQYLVEQHYTRSGRMAASSASAGGIIMGGALWVDPALFRVVLDDVGVSDALRMETEPNGPPNVPEFGSTSDEEGFHALYGISAYAHIRDGAPYPAVMFLTGANDPRVAPWHSLKMAARVQAATGSRNPVLLRVDYDAGHGIGSSRSQRANQLADEWAFAWWQMGLPAFQPK